jgi:hypothetical protein
MSAVGRLVLRAKGLSSSITNVGRIALFEDFLAHEGGDSLRVELETRCRAVGGTGAVPGEGILRRISMRCSTEAGSQLTTSQVSRVTSPPHRAPHVFC